MSATLAYTPTLAALYAPVRSPTAYEETVERLSTAIKLGLLPPGTRLPAERELCLRFGIARSTLRQALVTLAGSGHLRAVRGRGGGTFVSDPQPPGHPPTASMLAGWREACDRRTTVEVGVAVLAARRSDPAALVRLEGTLRDLQRHQDDYPAFRQGDIRFHVGLAEATGSPALAAQMTAVQGAVCDLIDLGTPTPETLAAANLQHGRILAAIRDGDEAAAAAAMVEHLQGTEALLAAHAPGSP